MLIAVDFDGTVVTHEFPAIGKPVPLALEYMKQFQEAGARLILWTMRSPGQAHGDVLQAAVDYCRENGVEFFGVNVNPEQSEWTSSNKAYAQLYIDDAAYGCPLLHDPDFADRPYVDWSKVGPAVLEMLGAGKPLPGTHDTD